MNLTTLFDRFDAYADPVVCEYGISKLRLFAGLCLSYIQCRSSIRDYFAEELFLKNRVGRQQFATFVGMNSWYKKHNDKEQAAWLRNKEEALYRFRQFIYREWCGYSYHSLESDYVAFAEKHQICIVKPRNDSCGRGIHIVDVNKIGGGTALYEYCHSNNVYPEELIVQHSIMSDLNKSSINTIRMVTVKGKCIGASVRMGVNGSIMDNASSGGFFAAIDIKSGIIISEGTNYKNERITRHPDTGTVIPGFQIPYWDECIQLVENAAHIVEKLCVVGWDVAVTPTGPTLVEANDEPEIPLLQIPLRKGVRKLVQVE